jgi:hypothetical protein
MPKNKNPLAYMKGSLLDGEFRRTRPTTSWSQLGRKTGHNRDRFAVWAVGRGTESTRLVRCTIFSIPTAPTNHLTDFTGLTETARRQKAALREA